ncbi:PREDICTED: ras-related protein Rab-24 [Corvus brachyrhynchos]|nr:PREDICTED: ras-related protein Rab-24 [Corvus brachyrhynchos]
MLPPTSLGRRPLVSPRRVRAGIHHIPPAPAGRSPRFLALPSPRPGLNSPVFLHRFPHRVPRPDAPASPGRFPPLLSLHFQTIGAAFVAKVMSVGDQTVTLGIWDTAGSERYEAMSRIYYRGARAAVVCYDLTDSGSFQRAKFWVNELQNCEEGCRIYLCGTKSDLLEEDRRKRGVDFHDVQDYADEIKADLFETSSKTGQSVDELFQKVAEDYINFSAFQVMTEDKGVNLGQRNSPYFYSCCHH